MSPTELPIACSLDASGFEEREAELASLGRRGLLGVERDTPRLARIRFGSDAQTRAGLERVISAESKCCPFLDLSLQESGELELTIAGPEGSEPVISDLLNAISAGRAESGG